MRERKVALSHTLKVVGGPRQVTDPEVLSYDWTKNGGQVKANLKYLRDVETAIARIPKPKNNNQEGSVLDEHFLATHAARRSHLPKLTAALDYVQLSSALKPVITQPILTSVSAWSDHHESRLPPIFLDVFPDARLNRLARSATFEQRGQTIFSCVPKYLLGTDRFLRLPDRSYRDIADPEQLQLFGVHIENANKFAIE